uniref:Uncharacterized protein n=1 Tax=Phlebotomus papatasi TaxID=29031 RepID=A0A1B0F0C9_PHLPP
MCDEVEKVVDAALHAKSVQLDCEEAFWTPISKGIHSHALYDLREADINDILDANINRVRFRKGWEKWKQSLEEEQSAQSASGGTSTSGKLGDGDTPIIQQRALPWTVIGLSSVLNCEAGFMLKTYYINKKGFDKHRRDDLVDLIIEYFNSQIVFLSTKSMQRLSEETQEIFQSEKRNYIILRKLPPRLYLWNWG